MNLMIVLVLPFLHIHMTKSRQVHVILPLIFVSENSRKGDVMHNDSVLGYVDAVTLLILFHLANTIISRGQSCAFHSRRYVFITSHHLGRLASKPSRIKRLLNALI